MTRIIAAPGRYSRQQGRQNSARSAGWRLGQALASLVALVFGWQILQGVTAGSFPVLDAGALAVGVVLAVMTGNRAKTAGALAARQASGTRAEEEVVTALRRAHVSLVINGAELRAGGDADHVVAHLRGRHSGVLAVVETKAGGGQVQLRGRTILSGRQARPLPRDPVGQVQRQAQALSRLTGRDVSPIVCLPGMVNGPLRIDGVVVCGTRHLAHLFDRALPGTAMDERDLAMLERTVKPKD